MFNNPYATATLSILPVVIIIALVILVFQGFGIYAIAKRRNVSIPWLAFIPIVSFWMIGQIADDYFARTGRKSKHYAKLILMLYGVGIIVVMLHTLLFTGLGMLGLMLSTVANIAGIVGLVYYYIALYHVYNSCRGVSSGGYLLFSLIFPISTPIFLFILKNKDDGLDSIIIPGRRKI